MTRRATIIFWSATAAAVSLLGGTVATLKAVLAGGSRMTLTLLVLSLGGLLGSLGVAGRIAVVVGRASRPDHPPTHHAPLTGTRTVPSSASSRRLHAGRSSVTGGRGAGRGAA